MQKLLSDITKFERHSKEGKGQFIEFIKEWSKNNLDNFVMSIEKNRFVLDIRNLFVAILSILNFSVILFILENLNMNGWIIGIILSIFTFGIQLKLIFFLLSFLLPSSNIILSKSDKKGEGKTQIIICAHYDIKNSFIRKQKGRIKGFLKYNIYSFSRLLTKYILSGDKMVLPISIFIYTWWFIPGNTIETAAISEAHQGFIPFAFNISSFMIVYSIFCAFLMIVLTLPFPKKLVNPGSDDNASGVVGALEIAKRLNNLKLSADIKVILFDNEERGLIGSSHFVAKNMRKLRKQKTFVINLDCIGRGSNIFVLGDRLKENKIYKSIEEVLESKGNNVRNSDIDFSDHKPFLNRGINAISIGRYNLKRYLWIKDFPVIDWIHGSEDKVEYVDIGKIEEVAEMVSEAIYEIYYWKESGNRDATG